MCPSSRQGGGVTLILEPGLHTRTADAESKSETISPSRLPMPELAKPIYYHDGQGWINGACLC